MLIYSHRLAAGAADCNIKQQLAANYTVLSAVLGLGNIWSCRLTIYGVNLGDLWLHPALVESGILVLVCAVS
jgi:hypothetical protein